MTVISFNQLTKIKNDGLVFYGLTDELKDFQEIINNEFNEKNLGSGSFEDKFKEIFEIFINCAIKKGFYVCLIFFDMFSNIFYIKNRTHNSSN